MTVIKDSKFPDRMRIKFLSDIPIEADEIEYLIELAGTSEQEPECPFDYCQSGDCQCDCKACEKCEEAS